MPTATATLTQFGPENFGTAQLGDRRRTRRRGALADRIASHPAGSLPETMKSPPQLKALDRLVRPAAVTHAAVLQPHRQRLRQRMEQHDGVLLLIPDTTELDSPGKRHSLKHLGPIGQGGRPGLLGHNTVVVEPRRRELWGLANQILVRRHRAPKGETRRAKRRRPTRERRIWKRGSEALGPVPAGRRWIDGCDRGADRFESIDHKHQQGQRYLVRSRSNRRVLVETPAGLQRPKLHDSARGLPELGRQPVEVPATETQPKRLATVRVAAAAVIVPPPRQRRGEHRDLPLATDGVSVGAIDPPAGAEPLEWILLSNEPTTPWEQARERIGW